jgi:hypothetical protein
MDFRNPIIAIRFLDSYGTSETFYDYKVLGYKRGELFLKFGKSAKRVQPGQKVQIRNWLYSEKIFITKQRMLERPASWWLSQPGTECLLAFVSGQVVDRGQGIDTEPSRMPEKVPTKVIFFIHSLILRESLCIEQI